MKIQNINNYRYIYINQYINIIFISVTNVYFYLLIKIFYSYTEYKYVESWVVQCINGQKLIILKKIHQIKMFKEIRKFSEYLKEKKFFKLIFLGHSI